MWMLHYDFSFHQNARFSSLFHGVYNPGLSVPSDPSGLFGMSKWAFLASMFENPSKCYLSNIKLHEVNIIPTALSLPNVQMKNVTTSSQM